MSGRSKKEKKQAIILGALVAVIIVGVLIMNKDKFLPQAGQDDEIVGTETRAQQTMESKKELFERPAFGKLKEYAAKVEPSVDGNPDLFIFVEN